VTGRRVVAQVLLAIGSSVLVALVVETLRAKGKLPSPSPQLPTPVAPGHDHV
jgi:hypothetical protein